MACRRCVACLVVCCELSSAFVATAVHRMPDVTRHAVAMVEAKGGNNGSSSHPKRQRRRKKAQPPNAPQLEDDQLNLPILDVLQGRDPPRRRKNDRSAVAAQAGLELLRDDLQRKRWRQKEYGPWKEQRLQWRQEMKQHAPGLFESMKLLDSDEIEDVENQYELVVKMTKELEWLLEQDFDGPKNSRSHVGLVAKAKAARTANDEPLPPKLIKNIQRIAEFRNALMHQRGVDAIPDREGFLGDWREVLAELRLERARVMEARQLAGFSKVLPRRPGDDFIRTELEDTPWKRMLMGKGNTTELVSCLFDIDEPAKQDTEAVKKENIKVRRRQRSRQRRPTTDRSPDLG